MKHRPIFNYGKPKALELWSLSLNSNKDSVTTLKCLLRGVKTTTK